MTRAVEEWIGKNDDEQVPRRVRVRVFTKADGCCAICQRLLHPGDTWDCDHRIAVINGGANRESNLQVLCEWCHKPKTVFDVKEKSKTYKRRAAHIGIRKRSTFRGWRKFDGTAIYATAARKT